MAIVLDPSGISLSFVAQLEAAALVVTYEVRNHSTDPVGLFNRFATVSPEGAPRVTAEAAYLDLVGDALCLSMRVLPVPPGLRVAARDLPYVTRVEAGASFEESVRFPRPVALRSPYRQALMQATAPSMHTVEAVHPATAARVRFELAAFRIVAPLTLREDSPGVLRVWPPGPALSGEILLSLETVLDAPLDVLDYAAVPIPDPPR